MTPIMITRIFTVMLFGITFICQAQIKSKLIRNLDNGKKQVIVAYGTSLTANGGWVKQLEEVLTKQYPDQVSVINSGGAGQYSEWGIKNLDRLVIQKHPDVVFLEFCINDCVERFNCPVEESKKNLETMIKHILKHNPECEIILMTMTPGNKYPSGHKSHRNNIEPYYEMYRTVAEQYKLKLIDHYPNWKKLQLADKKLFKKYVPDTIHPTPTGCSAVVSPVIIKALGLDIKE